MPTRKPVSVGKLFTGGILPRLLGRQRQLADLQGQLASLLPPPLEAHCKLLNLRGTSLILAVDSPLWANRLRFQTRTLLQQLSQLESVTVRTIQVRIRTEPGPGREKPKRISRISAENARLLEQTAHALKDERLRAALLRVASRGEKT